MRQTELNRPQDGVHRDVARRAKEPRPQRPLRILEFIDRLDTGGAETMVSRLSLRLQELGHTVSVVCLRDFGQMSVPIEEFQDRGVSLTEFRKKDGLSVKALAKLVRFLRQRRIEVIHAHNPLVTHYAAAAAMFARTPAFVSTIHGTSTLSMARWADALFAYSCRWNDRIVLVCRQVEEVFGQKYAALRNRTAVIPNGIPVDELLAIPRKYSNRPEFVFGSVGRLTAVKDHQTLLTAFANVKKYAPACRLEILGCGELLDDLEAQARALGIQGSVRFRGWSRGVAEFLAEIDAFVLSSKSEGLPMTLLEAMAAGLPVVSTAVGGIPEIVNSARCGWLAAAGDPAGLAGRMLEAHHAPDLPDRGSRAREAAAANYSVKSMADQYGRLFADLSTGTGRCQT